METASKLHYSLENCVRVCVFVRVQGNSGREDVLFLRLHLLQSLLSYIEGDDAQARLQLDQVKRFSFSISLT